MTTKTHKRSIAALLAVVSFCVAPAHADQYETIGNNLTYPESQGWGQDQMRIWYELSQGSRLAPLSWIKALKLKDGTEFLSREHLASLGYNYFNDTPYSLPIGFILDKTSANSDPWLGFNCSACHTANLKVGTAQILIHGGQNMADFQKFMANLISALVVINQDNAAFDKFASQVLGPSTTAAAKTTLKAQLADWLAFRVPINDTASDVQWGRGRADAVGVILATTAMVVADPNVPIDQREPLPASNAPVSYPFVWNTNQQARLQHNGIVDNGTNIGVVKVAKVGALIRNWTEALGVFADVKLDAAANKVNSSIRLDNLLLIEQALADLQSPLWPDVFGKLDEARRIRGKVLYSENCSACHSLLNSDDIYTNLPLIDKPSWQKASDPKAFLYLQPVFDEKTRPSAFIKTHTPSPDFIGTDPGMACNSLLHKVPSGRMQGQKNVEGFIAAASDRVFSDRAVTTDLLRVLIQRDVLANRTKTLYAIAENQIALASSMLIRTADISFADIFNPQGASDDPLAPLRAQLQYCATMVEAARAYAPDSPIPVYKARPLNGIWATAPYIHNGSVPTLYDLLLPQKQRPKSFGYFDGALDPEKGGLKDASANPFATIFRVYDKDGIVITGNWNGGHEYGTKLSLEQRIDLVEYLKGL